VKRILTPNQVPHILLFFGTCPALLYLRGPKVPSGIDQSFWIILMKRCGPGSVGRIVWSVQRLPTGWGSGDRIPVMARFSAPVQTGSEAHPASCAMRTGSFPGVRSGRGVTLTPQTLLVPRSKIE
jgi:hypothetical protein